MYGTKKYHPMSAICASAVHAGMIGAEGGRFEIYLIIAPKTYDGTKFADI